MGVSDFGVLGSEVKRYTKFKAFKEDTGYESFIDIKF